MHFHLIPYADPAMVRHELGDEMIRTHDDAMRAITQRLAERMDPSCTPCAGWTCLCHSRRSAGGEDERVGAAAVDGAEHVKAEYFRPFPLQGVGICIGPLGRERADSVCRIPAQILHLRGAPSQGLLSRRAGRGGTGDDFVSTAPASPRYETSRRRNPRHRESFT